MLAVVTNPERLSKGCLGVLVEGVVNADAGHAVQEREGARLLSS